MKSVFFQYYKDGSGLEKLQTSEFNSNYHICAPLWQQAFEFFLKRGYWSDIKPDLTLGSLWSFRVVNINEKYDFNNLHHYKYSYYKDARLACLEKLIEILTK